MLFTWKSSSCIYVDKSSLYPIAAYLVGSSICGVILDAIVAMEVGIYQGR